MNTGKEQYSGVEIRIITFREADIVTVSETTPVGGGDEDDD